MNDVTLSAPSGYYEPRSTPPKEAAPLINGFELQQEIGFGGMGVVFRARDLMMDREVAIKVLQSKFSPDSSVAHRFLDEARITGQLQHPGIPAVYQVGTLQDNRPFLAMKLIKGETLEKKWKDGTLEDKLGIFEAVAQAVGYAHARGVIHRDLKPANIMIGAFGEVQVMDWGLAKVLGTTSTSAQTQIDSDTRMATEIRTLRDSDGNYTQAGSILGTPAYMSPEQAAGELDKIDARSDVFGLGGILCFMLIGKPPFSGENAEQIRLNAMRGKMEEVHVLLSRLPEDPEVISLCRRCLAFEPQDRFSQANEIWEHVSRLRRVKEDRLKQAELAQARAEVRTAELQHRRRIWLGLAVTLLVGLVASVALGLWAYLARNQAELSRQSEELSRQEAQKKQMLAEQYAEKARQNELKAIRNEKQAKDQADIATAVKEFFLRDLMQLAGPLRQAQASELKMDPDIKVRDLVLRSARLIEGKFADQPLIEAEIREALGSTLWDLGLPILAVPHFERCYHLLKPLLGDEHPTTLRSMEHLVGTYDLVGRQEEALKLAEEVMRITRMQNNTQETVILMRMNTLAFSYAAVHRHQEAVSLYQEVLDRQTKLLGLDHPDTLSTMNNLSLSYAALDRKEEMLRMRETVFERSKQLYGPDHLSTSTFQHNLGRAYSIYQRPEDAIRMHQQALAIRKMKLGAQHRETYWSMIVLGEAYRLAGKNGEAVDILRTAIQGLKATVGVGDPVCLWAMGHLASTLQAQGKRQEALLLREEIVTHGEKSRGADHVDTLEDKKILARTYAEAGRWSSAQRLYREILQSCHTKYGQKHDDTIWCQEQLADVLEQQGQLQEAVQIDRLIMSLREKQGVDHQIFAINRLARRLTFLQKYEESLSLYHQLLELQKNKWGLYHSNTLETRYAMATCLKKMKKDEQVLLLLEQTWTEIEQADKLSQKNLSGPLMKLIILAGSIQQQRQNLEGCLGVAERFEKVMLTNSGSLYHAARLRSVLAGQYQRSTLPEKEKLSQVAMQQSLDWLKKAVTVGLKSRSVLTKNLDFNPVRTHPDFQKLVDAMPTGTMFEEVKDMLTIPGLQQTQQNIQIVDVIRFLEPLRKKLPESSGK